MFVGIGNIARRAADVYVGVNGVARRVMDIYVGVNGVARRAWTAGTPIGNRNVGDIVSIHIAGSPVEFLVAHKGRPQRTGNEYPADSVTLITRNIYTVRQWHTSNSNAYASSAIHAWLNNEFLNSIEQSVRDRVIEVRIPFRPGASTSTTTNTSGSGMLARVFLPSASDMVYFNDESLAPSIVPIRDGGVLSLFYFLWPANAGRTATFNGVVTQYFTRTPGENGTTHARVIGTDGSIVTSRPTSEANGIRPVFVLPNDALVR